MWQWWNYLYKNVEVIGKRPLTTSLDGIANPIILASGPGTVLVRDGVDVYLEKFTKPGLCEFDYADLPDACGYHVQQAAYTTNPAASGFCKRFGIVTCTAQGSQGRPPR